MIGFLKSAVQDDACSTFPTPYDNDYRGATLRTHRDGFKTMQYPWYEEYYVYNDHNIALCTNEQPNFINQDKSVLSYEKAFC